MLGRLSSATFHFPALCEEQVSWNRGEGDAQLPRALGKAWGVWLRGRCHTDWRGNRGGTILRPRRRPHSTSVLSSEDLHLEGSALCSIAHHPRSFATKWTGSFLPPCPVMVTPWAHATTPPPCLTPGVTRSLGAGLLINVRGCRRVAQGPAP